MSIRSHLQTFVFASAWCGCVAASLAETHVEAPTPEALVTQLSDPDPTKQADARTALLSLGDAAKPALEAFTQSRGTTAALLSAIDANVAAGPTYVTLKMDNATVDAVLKALSKQSGYSLKPYNQGVWAGRGNQTKISVDYQRTPFWDAVVDLCRKAQISPYLNSGSGKQLMFLPTAQMGMSFIDCPLSTQGAAMTLCTNLSRQDTVTFNGNAVTTRHDFSGQVMVLLEPKMRVTRYSYLPALEEAVDDKGNSLLVPRENGEAGWNSNSQQTQINLGLNLKYPASNPGTKIVKLRGTVKLTVAVRTEPVEFTDLTGDKEQTLTTPSGRRLTLVSVKPTKDGDNDTRQYLAQVILYRDKLDREQFNQQFNNPGLTVLDAQGRELQFQNVRDSSSNGMEARMSLVYYRRSADDGGEDVGVPTKVIWETTTQTRDINLPFEFKDLPMP